MLRKTVYRVAGGGIRGMVSPTDGIGAWRRMGGGGGGGVREAGMGGGALVAAMAAIGGPWRASTAAALAVAVSMAGGFWRRGSPMAVHGSGFRGTAASADSVAIR